jgi:hypothetical protein
MISGKVMFVNTWLSHKVSVKNKEIRSINELDGEKKGSINYEPFLNIPLSISLLQVPYSFG